MKIDKFEDLEIWIEARSLSKAIFEVTNRAEFSKDFKFKYQIRDAIGSVMDNTSEGFERGGNKEFHQFLSIAKGSCGEVRSQLYRALDYQYVDEQLFQQLMEKALMISKKISNLMSYLKQTEFKGNKFKSNEPPNQIHEL